MRVSVRIPRDGKRLAEGAAPQGGPSSILATIIIPSSPQGAYSLVGGRDKKE